MDKRTEVLAFFWDTLLPKAGMQTEARQLLKEKLLDHESYRAFSGAGEVSWMSRLAKSGLETFALIEDLVFGVKFDNQLRKAALTGSIVENVFETSSSRMSKRSGTKSQPSCRTRILSGRSPKGWLKRNQERRRIRLPW